MSNEPIEPREPTPGDSSPDLASEWRSVGEALARLGGGIGESVRSAWESSGATAEAEGEPEAPSQGLRRVADAFDRGVESARRAATSPEARARVNADARQAGSRLEHAMRLSIAELGRTLQRVAPDDRGDATSDRATEPETPGPVPTSDESSATDDPADRP